MALPFSLDFVPFDILTAEQMDQMVANDQALAAGTGLDNSSISASKLLLGASTNSIATVQATANQSYSDLGTVGPSVTVTIGAGGVALALFSSEMYNNGINGVTYACPDVSGANTIAPSDARAMSIQAYGNNAGDRRHGQILYTGLTPGSTTFKLQYKVNSNTGTWATRTISVIPLG